MKKICLILILMLGTALSSVAATAGAWKVIPMLGTGISEVVDTPDMVYYVSDGSLYSYDKTNSEVRYYQPGKHISSPGIKFLKYNVDARYLMCVYTDNNIDIIYQDGRLVNLSEIKNSNVTGDKTINSVSFDNGTIYVATAFGIVVYDEKKMVVKESGIFNKNVQFAQRFGNQLVINFDYNLWTAPIDVRHNTVEKFTKRWNVGMSDIARVSDDSFITISAPSLNMVKMNFETNEISMTEISKAQGATRIYAGADGYFIPATGKIITVDRQGGNLTTVNLPANFGTQVVGMWSSPSSVWAGDENGLANYDISNGGLTVLKNKYISEGSVQKNTRHVAWLPDQSEVYFNGVGYSGSHPLGSISAGQLIPLLLESYNWNTGKITRRYPICPTNNTKYSQNAQKLDGRQLLFGGCNRSAVDPVDSSFIYAANSLDGLVVLKNRKQYYYYNEFNSPLVCAWRSRVMDLKFDQYGNLWIAILRADASIGKSVVKVLTKDKLQILRTTPEKLTETDADGNYIHWQDSKWNPEMTGNLDTQMEFIGNTLAYIDGTWEGPMTAVDTKGTPSTDDDQLFVFDNCEDQDGNVYKTYCKNCMAVDRRNQLWLGTTTGIHVVRNASDLISTANENLKVVRPKVSRNDGTNYADYLLNSDNVLCIAVDNSNRKWIGTEASGLYLVNEDGTAVLQHFTKDNSPFTTDAVTMLACDPNGNDVLVGTPEGVYVYSSDSAPGADDFSGVYAYPNPVRPDYTGWITIEGLMANSVVKIADIKGNVIWNGRSEGGMAVWDGCDASGNRVPSGVYLVLASNTDGTETTGVATKIVVIN